MPQINLSFESGEKSLTVRSFSTEEAISRLFQVSITAMSPRADVDIESLVGRSASLLVESGVMHVTRWGRHWTGVVSHIEQLAVETSEKGLSTYSLTISPTLWLLTQRRGRRIFQHLSAPDIADKLLAEWSIKPKWAIDRGAYPKLEYKVQHGESDFAFLSRLLEEAGIAFTFPQTQEKGSSLLFGDDLISGKPHDASPIPYVDSPNQAAQKEFVTAVQLSHGVRPGAYTIRDHDFRNPSFALMAKAPPATGPEARLEQYHFAPGAFLVENGKGGGTPVADDKGVARHDASFGNTRAAQRLIAERADKRQVAFSTNVLGLEPGMIFSMDLHPHPELASSERLLITELSLEGTVEGEWNMMGRAVSAKIPYRPPLVTDRPEARGVESATVVGPAGEDIYADEYGRVRVQFPWDREGKNDDDSSCWMRVSQGWAGAGFGAILLPRVGEEVLVGFLSGDPDQPIIVGRVFNGKSQVPYKLPENKSRSTWKSNSYPGGGGFNEILFEDARDRELVFMQAQKNQRRLVKNDEAITVGHDRRKLVKNDEIETTNRSRTEVVGEDRTEITDGNQTISVGKSRGKLVKGDEIEETRGAQRILVGGKQDIVIRGEKRESMEGAHHVTVAGDQRGKVKGSVSFTIDGGREEKIGQRHALKAGAEIHIEAGTSVVIEGADDLTLKGPGGFIRICEEGIYIKGRIVNINSGGTAGTASEAKPIAPDPAAVAEVIEPARPAVDDISVTGLGQ